jgi:four helix bundle protein
MSDEFFFEKLQIYKRSLEFAKNLCQRSSNFPLKFSRIRDLLIGAVISIPLNIAEGSGRRSIKEKINFYKIARTSLFECVPLLEICLELGMINKSEYQNFRSEIVALSKMINGLIKSLFLFL